jgi:hypothetical protein
VQRQQRQRVFELHNLSLAVSAHDFKARQSSNSVVQIDFTRLADY